MKGYAYYKGRKVIVGEIDEAIPLEAIIELSPEYQDTKRHLEALHGKTVADVAAANAFLDEPDIIINGYVLLDPHTFFLLKSVMAAKQNGNAILEQIIEAEKI